MDSSEEFHSKYLNKNNGGEMMPITAICDGPCDCGKEECDCEDAQTDADKESG